MARDVDYDPFAADTLRDPFPAYAELRASCPVHRFDDYAHPLWTVTRYDDVTALLTDIDLCHEDVSTLAGMERWFTRSPSRLAPPPRYKTAALILLGLYPLLLFLDLVLGPRLSELPRPLGLLASLSVSVPLMVWIVLPWLTGVFRGWLHPRATREVPPEDAPGPAPPVESSPRG